MTGTSTRKGQNNSKSNKVKPALSSNAISFIFAFLLGVILCTSCFLIFWFETSTQNPVTVQPPAFQAVTNNILAGKRILVAIASFDFSQIPHLEEVLDGYRDVCESGAIVHVYIHTTVPYPTPLIDLLNSRLTCTTPQNFAITISLRSPSLRLHLADVHRVLFYELLDEYDLFVYTEDDIRVRPTTLAAYIKETNRVIDLVGKDKSTSYNVGIVRYEYNFPPDIIIDDKTRHATQNVTRVYWEHVAKPIAQKALQPIQNDNQQLKQHYISMGNHHQGMFIATQHLLKAWKFRSNDHCRFDQVRDRPSAKNNPGQPSEGTQRVWMSSHMMYGSRHCNVGQLIPMVNFGALTVLHLPNKNYRRVGKKGRIGGNKQGAEENEFGDKSEKFVGPDPSLLTAMQVHWTIYKHYLPKERKGIYNGIMMVDNMEAGYFKNKQKHMQLVDKRMEQFHDYVARGGVLLESDWDGIAL